MPSSEARGCRRLLPAIHGDGEAARQLRESFRGELRVRRAPTVGDVVDVEEAAHQRALDGEVDVLQYVGRASRLRDADGVELARHHADDVPGAVE